MSATIKLPPDMPARMKGLPRDDVGRPVPYFVQWVDGEPDFRIMNSDHLLSAIKEQLCWVCGQRLLRQRPGSPYPKGTFVAGPMCLVNRTSAEPPCHDDCAEWCSKACPFLSKPAKERRETGLPEVTEGAGIAIKRNPGVTALIECSSWAPFQHNRGVLFKMTRVTGVKWMALGGPASAAQVLDSIDSGVPLLWDMAYEEGPEATREMALMTKSALRFVDTTEIAAFPNITRVLKELP